MRVLFSPYLRCSGYVISVEVLETLYSLLAIVTNLNCLFLNEVVEIKPYILFTQLYVLAFPTGS